MRNSHTVTGSHFGDVVCVWLKILTPCPPLPVKMMGGGLDEALFHSTACKRVPMEKIEGWVLGKGLET